MVKKLPMTSESVPKKYTYKYSRITFNGARYSGRMTLLTESTMRDAPGGLIKLIIEFSLLTISNVHSKSS